jgi:hypothetical protein
MKKDLGEVFPWLRDRPVLRDCKDIAEPADPDWWKRPFAGRAPPPGSKPGRPWFSPEPGVVVDEHGYRWTQPGGAQVPSRPTGTEPDEGLTQILQKAEREYWNEK